MFYASPGSLTCHPPPGGGLRGGPDPGYHRCERRCRRFPATSPTAGCGRATCSTPTTPPTGQEGFTGKGQTGDRVRVRRLSTSPTWTCSLPRPASRHWCPRWWAGCRSASSVRPSMDLQVVAIAPDAVKLVLLLNARPTTTNDGGRAFVKLGRLMESADERFPRRCGASRSVGLRPAVHGDRLRPYCTAPRTGAGQWHHRLQRQRRPGRPGNAKGRAAVVRTAPDPTTSASDAVASLPGDDGRRDNLSTDADGHWLGPEQSWYNIRSRSERRRRIHTVRAAPGWQTVGIGTELPDRRLVPDVSAVSDRPPACAWCSGSRSPSGAAPSQAAPIWAGLSALMNDKLTAGAPALGRAFNPLLYEDGQNPDPGRRDSAISTTAATRSASRHHRLRRW